MICWKNRRQSVSPTGGNRGPDSANDTATYAYGGSSPCTEEYPLTTLSKAQPCIVEERRDSFDLADMAAERPLDYLFILEDDDDSDDDDQDDGVEVTPLAMI